MVMAPSALLLLLLLAAACVPTTRAFLVPPQPHLGVQAPLGGGPLIAAGEAWDRRAAAAAAGRGAAGGAPLVSEAGREGGAWGFN